jgi:hypothetical protein
MYYFFQFSLQPISSDLSQSMARLKTAMIHFTSPSPALLCKECVRDEEPRAVVAAAVDVCEDDNDEV